YALGFGGSMADRANLALVVPDVVLQRRDIEVAHQHDPPPARMNAGPGRHLLKEGELVGKLLVKFRIRLGAAGGHVEVMDLEGLAATEGQCDRQVPLVVLAAPDPVIPGIE